ncbi:MAG TPA: acyl-CoA dehydrogenase family protein [Candidatus Limnocylindrales bacterium]
MTSDVRSTSRQAGGGAFLISAASPDDILTPERLSPEHRAIRDAVGEFVAREVGPRVPRIEAKDWGAHRELLAILGRDGFVGVDVPEAFGGAGLDKTSSVVVTEALGAAPGFSVTFAAHTGIGTLPLVFFGTEEQRRRYLPGLADGTTVAAYALTEPSAGSDARGIRTKATREPDGSWRLDGSKQFITNAGFADLFTVYAKVDGEEFTAFLVERGTPGLTIGPEEHKLGINGSSTCPLTFDGAIVPAGNLLGEIGKGHRVAFNVLNVGRFKLAAAVLGAMKPALATTTAYARDRVAFGRPIAGFPLVAAKLGRMAARTYAVESLVYRVAGMIDARLTAAEARDAESPGSESATAADEVRAALEELAVECSIAKIVGSEELDAVVDEMVQVHGGYGYIEDYPAARAYRDARINRIWEGTSEINRLLIPDTLLKRAIRGRLDLLAAARRAQEALLAGPSGDEGEGSGPLATERRLVDGLRTVTLLLAGAAVQRWGVALEEEQEVLAAVADLAIATLTMESAVLRADAAAAPASGTRPETAETIVDLARVVVADRVGPAELAARTLATRVADGDDARLLLSGIRRFLRSDPVDTIELTRRAAAHVVAAGGYPV